MKKLTTYANKKVFVLGLARSGVAASKLLNTLGAFVTVNDSKTFEENPQAWIHGPVFRTLFDSMKNYKKFANDESYK